MISLAFHQLAVICLLTRILEPSRCHRWFLWWMGTWCMLTFLATCGILLGQCSPIAALWDFSIPGTCVPKRILVAYCQYAGGPYTGKRETATSFLPPPPKKKVHERAHFIGQKQRRH